MAESVLDIIIRAAGAQLGAQQVNKHLDTIAARATQVTNHLKTRFDNVKNSVFSLQGALVALGVGALGKSLFDAGKNLDLMQRSLRTVTTSSGEAAAMLQKLRRISDEFQLGDAPMVESFRLLASHGIPNVEKAIRTVASAALATGQDIESVTLGIIAGQERFLRKLGIDIEILADGSKLIVSQTENAATRVAGTDEALRTGLLATVGRLFPDQTKKMGDSFDFQFKRIEDLWDDLKIEIMQGGLGDFFAQTFRTIADQIGEGDLKKAGQRIAAFLQDLFITIARDVATVIDAVMPLGKILVNILGTALSAFNKLPPWAQAIGIFGGLLFGVRGVAAITAALFLLEKTKDLADWFEAHGLPDLNSRKRTEGAKDARVAEPGEKLPGMDTLGLGNIDEESSTVLGKLDRFIAEIKKRQEQAKRNREMAAAQADADRRKGKGGVVTTTVDVNDERMQAELRVLEKQTRAIEQVEAIKRDPLFNEEEAEAFARMLQEIARIEKDQITITKQRGEELQKIFQRQADAVHLTRVQKEAEQERLNTLMASNELEGGITLELEEARAMAEIQQKSIGMRDLETAKLKFNLELMKGQTMVSTELKEALMEKLRLIDEERKKVQSLQLHEQQRLSVMEEIAQLNAETRDMSGGIRGQPIGAFPGGFGQQTPSRETLIEERKRQFAAQDLPFDELKIAKEVDMKLEAQRANFIARTNFEIEQQIRHMDIEIDTMGMSTDLRQMEIRIREELLALQQKGITLTEEETERLREQQERLQERIANQRTVQAINSFVDSFRVGWDTIVKSGEQAYSHLEDAMTQWIMTGKLDFTNFVNFVSQELIRMGIRASLSKLLGAGMDAGGGFNFGSLIGAGFSMFKGEGFGAAAATGGAADLGAGAFANQPLFAQKGGVFDRFGRVPGFQRGGINSHHKFIEVSEGHTQEAIIPLQGGKVPVKMMSGGGTTIHAPITIVTPDAAGVRRSETQIQAQMSTALLRSSRRIN